MSRNIKQQELTEQTKEETFQESDEFAEQVGDEVLSKIKMDFAADWRTSYTTKNVEALEKYIRDEIQKCIDGGYKVLSSILQLNATSEVVPRTVALKMLRQDMNFAADYSGVALALVPEKLRTEGIPHHDYNGCLLPPAKRGKVLSAKVTFRGNKDLSSHGEGEGPELIRSLKYGASAFVRAQANRVYGNPTAPYFCIEISDKPKFVSLDDSISILERYGYGVAKSRIGKKGLWLVTEA